MKTWEKPLIEELALADTACYGDYTFDNPSGSCQNPCGGYPGGGYPGGNGQGGFTSFWDWLQSWFG